ncbi:NUDIX hydrolase [bacterium]|nr:NUDIX hydrolase [bacterium]
MKLSGRDFLIHLKQSFYEQEIILHDLNYKREYSPNTQALIEAEWKQVTENKEIFIFNGPVSCLDHYEVVENKLHIYYFESDYKSYYGTNIRSSRSISDKSELANTLAVCTVVETSDNKIIVGRRGKHLAEGTSLWHVPGGTLEYYPDRVNHPFDVMRRELEEELNLTSISSMICLGLGENLNFKKPEFLLYTTTNLTSTEIAKKLEQASDANEHSEIRFIPAHEISEFMDNNNFTEIGTAAVELYLDMSNTDKNR